VAAVLPPGPPPITTTSAVTGAPLENAIADAFSLGYPVVTACYSRSRSA
jgi:hypothetical protein